MKFSSIVLSSFLVSNVRSFRSIQRISHAGRNVDNISSLKSTRCTHGGFIMQLGALRDFGRNEQKDRVNVPLRLDIIHHFSRTCSTRHFQSSVNNNEHREQLSMENLYEEWSLKDDQFLHDNRAKSIITLASTLGRGLRGVESRLEKLRDMNSPAYQRLFVDQAKVRKAKDEQNTDDNEIKTEKLVPALEILNRIQWDASLPSKDFSIMHYDRVDGVIMETSVLAPNDAISGRATRFVDALPEHRIVAIKYKERIVWDRMNRSNLFLNNGESSDGIRSVIANYAIWKQENDAAAALELQRKAEVGIRMQKFLGISGNKKLQTLLQVLVSTISSDPKRSRKIEVERFVEEALDIFRSSRNDPDASSMPEEIPISDYFALDAISELISLVPLPDVRDMVFTELNIQMKETVEKKAVEKRMMPELNENDIVESFVRGSGPGGQKVNKTSNRVVLLHKPTGLQVECQDTRSLPQNRKIARKRLLEKLDDFMNGSQSKSNMKSKEASVKKIKAKAKAKARLRQKQEGKVEDSKNNSEDENFSE